MAVKCMEGPFVFRLNENGTGPHLLVQVQLIAIFHRRMIVDQIFDKARTKS